ncbi:uncharacterized protein LOC106717061 [Papilio machaon]|uniref:uncharacterized protein LOC106717061 n=1 Tax=Papilio machaon TaxID=76193 RepID=UPI001E665E37|nr:uncharacterized protein LOC106717061 [Papilio machaon]
MRFLRMLFQRSRSSRSGATTGKTTGDVTGNTTGVSEETENTQETDAPQDPEDPRDTATYEIITDPQDLRKEIQEIVAQYSEALFLDDIEGACPPVITLDDQQPENDEINTTNKISQDDCEDEGEPDAVELKELVITNQPTVGEAGILDDLEFMDEEPQDDDDDEEE